MDTPDFQQTTTLPGRQTRVHFNNTQSCNLALLSQVRVTTSLTGSRRKIEKEGHFSGFCREKAGKQQDVTVDLRKTLLILTIFWEYPTSWILLRAAFTSGMV